MRLPDLAAAAHHEVEGAGRQRRAADDLGQRPAAGRHQLGRLEHHAVAVGQRRRDLPGRDRERKVPGRDQADHADRLARDVDLHAGPHRGHRFAAGAQRLAGEELEDLAGARRFADGLGQGLAFFARQQHAQLVACAPAVRCRSGRARRHGAAAWCGSSAAKASAAARIAEFGLAAVGAGVLGHHLARVRRVLADAGGHAGFPAAVDVLPGVLLEVGCASRCGECRNRTDIFPINISDQNRYQNEAFR